jgi:hypothetical protein
MKSTINKDMKTYVEYDETNPDVKAFAKIWIAIKKHHKNPAAILEVIKGRAGFVGSGKWTYKFNDKKFEVSGYANGKGFWGTDYSITEVTE